MKFVSLILLIFASVHGQSQNIVDDVLDLQISCGFGGRTSKEVQILKKSVYSNDTITIIDRLFFGSKLEQVLAAIILKYYQETGSLQLTDPQLKMISQISRRKDKFSLCFTCTYEREGSIKKLFTRRNFSGSYSIIESSLLEKP